MLYHVTDEAFLTSARCISRIINNTQSAVDLLKLKPSINVLRRQCTNKTRTWTLVTLLQDWNHKSRCLGLYYENPTRMP